MEQKISSFFNSILELIRTKHKEGVFNTVCLVVLMGLPFVVLIASIFICCHCCFSSFETTLWLVLLSQVLPATEQLIALQYQVMKRSHSPCLHSRADSKGLIFMVPVFPHSSGNAGYCSTSLWL